MRKLMTIGELAKLFEINTTKIRFYERKGLLKASQIDENGYRLYSFKDMERLEHLLLLRDLDVPIERIKELMSGYMASDYEELLIELLDETEKHLNFLKRRKAVITERLNHFKDYTNERYRVVSLPKKDYYLIEEDLDLITSEKMFYDIYEKYDLPLSDYSMQYIFEITQDAKVSKGIVSKDKRFTSLEKRTMKKGDYLELRIDFEHPINDQVVLRKAKELVEESGLKVSGPLYGFEDYRLFLFSNVMGYLKLYIKIES